MFTNLNFLKSICKMSELQLYNFLPIFLRQNGYNNITVNNNIPDKGFIYASGNIPVLLVAHLDTVHKQPPKDIFYDPENTILWSPQGIGADDRAGVFAILDIISDNNITGNNKDKINNNSKYNNKPYILFTSGEEEGGFGAITATKVLSIPKVKYIIELDRKGFNDAIFYNCFNQKFINYILSFGFIENYGSFSDISVLCPYWNIAGVNLSIGYYNAHTKHEYLNITEMNNTITVVKTMLNNLPKSNFKYYTDNSKHNSKSKKSRKNKNYLYNSYEFYFEDDYYTDEELQAIYEYSYLKN